MRAYEVDFAGWAQDTARAICDGRWSEIDRTALADEVESLAKRERRAIRSRFEVLFLHLLKRRFQPARASRSWDATIVQQRFRLRERLDENPSLAIPHELWDIMVKAYAFARLKASEETGLEVEVFPVEMPFTDAEIWGG